MLQWMSFRMAFPFVVDIPFYHHAHGMQQIMLHNHASLRICNVGMDCHDCQMLGWFEGGNDNDKRLNCWDNQPIVI